MLAKTTKMISLSQLKDAPWNPSHRVSLRKIKQLADSLSADGQLIPILVTTKNVIVDGHRRAYAARSIGWDTIECRVTDREPEAVYAAVNTHVSRMGGNDALGVWLKNPNAIGGRTRQRLETIAEQLGRSILHRLYDEGLSIRTYDMAKGLARHLDMDEPETVKKILTWLIKFGSIGQVQKALQWGVPARDILRSVESGKPFNLKLKVS
jgi:hypothetical protein